MERYFLIVDLGSNSVRMDIIEVRKNGLFRVAKRMKKSCRLSEGLTEGNLLQPEATERTVRVLKELRKAADEYPLTGEFAVATEALRRAENRDEFIERAKRETGFSFTVIDGEKEAYYDYLGVVRSMKHRDFLLLDTGGGSSELVLVKGGEMKAFACIPYGSITLTEQFAEAESMNRDEFERNGKMISEALEGLEWLSEAHGLPVVGLGGSIRTMIKIHQKKMNHNRPLHNYRMMRREVVQFRDDILRMNRQQRRSIAGMDVLRSDIITGGILPLNVLMEKISSPYLIASAYGLREGLCYEKLEEITNL